MIGVMLRRALERAGLVDAGERALAGKGLAEGDLARLRAADTLVLAGLADAVRARHRGDDVRMSSEDVARRGGAVVLDVRIDGADGPTGEEILREVALARLVTAGSKGIAVRIDAVGLELAQTALVFGADVLCADLRATRALPLLDAADRRTEITGLVERAGRRVVWQDGAAQPSFEGRP